MLAGRRPGQLRPAGVGLHDYDTLEMVDGGCQWRWRIEDGWTPLGFVTATFSPGKVDKATLGYALYLPDKDGNRGVMTTAVGLVLTQLTNGGVERVEALILETNYSSARVVQKNGFVNTGVVGSRTINNRHPMNICAWVKPLNG